MVGASMLVLLVLLVLGTTIYESFSAIVLSLLFHYYTSASSSRLWLPRYVSSWPVVMSRKLRQLIFTNY